jgi:hypothetical protein
MPRKDCARRTCQEPFAGNRPLGCFGQIVPDTFFSITANRLPWVAGLVCWLSLLPLARGDYAAEVRRDGPVAWWRFQDADSREGATAQDASGTHSGTYRGAVVLDGGPPGSGGGVARFDGRSYVEVAHQADFALHELSVEFWFRATQGWEGTRWPFAATFVTKATENAHSSDWTINGGGRGTAAEGRVFASSGATTASGGDLILGSRRVAANDGQWHHVVWTRTADGTCTLYFDGRCAATDNDGGGSVVNQRPLQIGGDPFLKGRFLVGAMAEVAIYRQALDAVRVQTHFRAGGGRESPATIKSGRQPLNTVSLTNAAGLSWDLLEVPDGWALGRVAMHGRPVDADLLTGVLALRHMRTGKLVPLWATQHRRLGARGVELGGQAKIDGAQIAFSVALTLSDELPAARLNAKWSVGQDLDGYEVCVAYHDLGQEDWRCTLYPFAGNSRLVSRPRLTFCGVPAAMLFRPDLSLVTLFGIDPASDYLNPTTWTGATGFHFEDQETAPQFRVGGGKLQAGVDYCLPLQLFFTDAGNSATAITALVRDWRRVNSYQVEPLRVRSHQEGFDLFLRGRLHSKMWREGLGYQIMENWKVIYTAEAPINAWFDYLVYEQTGDPRWRQRALDALTVVLAAQHKTPNDPHFGAIETNFELEEHAAKWKPVVLPLTEQAVAEWHRVGRFNSRDHSPNWHYKVDMHAYAARYLLQLWERFKQREGVDRQDWRDAAVRIADWVVKQQNHDGGLPQVVDDDPAKKSMSVVSGRALTAFPVIYRITGDDKYRRFSDQLEQFLRTKVESRFWFTGAHVDLWPQDFEADSVWHAVEYWLDKFERTHDQECLRRAEADAWFAFLMWCPRQLAWVRNPTQTCHTEQEHYLQYSNYCYNNRKYYCLDRLAKLTGEKLFADLCERIIQCGFWAQATAGPWLGGTYERMSDPWRGVSADVNSQGQVYISELALDSALQLLEMGWVTPRGK